MIKRVIPVAVLCVLVITAFVMGMLNLYPVKYLSSIRQNAGRLNPSLVCAVIHAESRFKPDALSHKGAAGLMQVTDETAEWIASLMKTDDFEQEHIFEPDTNIAMGCYFLNWLMNYYDDDLTLALCAYNAGIGNVDRWLKDRRYSADGQSLDYIPFPETRRYVQRVTQNQRIYRIMLVPYTITEGAAA